MNATPAITVSALTKRYRLFGRRTQFATLKSALLKRDMTPSPESSIEALRNLSFEIASGESFGVIGPNGSGKSTLLKIISGILKPTSGLVAVNGRVSALIELGAGFHPEISGRENIYINGIMLGLTRRQIDRKFHDIVEFAGIGEFLEQPVKTYSSGMYVRLGFSVAVHSDPDILLIDEVLSVGDEAFSQQCVERIREMQYRGVTMMFVTHQLELVRALCDRAIWLDHGSMAAIGDPVRVVDQYLQKVSGRTIEADEVEEPEEIEDEKDETAEERWGSREITIDRVALTDERSRELVALGGSSHVEIDIRVSVNEPQEDYVVGVAIFHTDGTCVFGTNTDVEGFEPDRIAESGRVRFVIPSLQLVAGTYRIDVAVHTKNGRAFDFRRGALRFVVGSIVKDSGVYRPDHEWIFEGGISMRRAADPRRNIPTEVAETLRGLEDEERDAGRMKGQKNKREKQK